MNPRAILAALLIALVGAGAAAAEGIPRDLSADPLDRGVLLALPSIYRVDVTVHVDALRLADGTRRALAPAARRFGESGTAVAVAPGGWLVTAGHVAAPDGPTLARLAYQNDRAERDLAHGDEAGATEWVRRNRARVLGPGVIDVTVRQADAGGGADASRSIRVLRVVRSATADLALIQIDAPEAPALTLDEAASSGTPVATIGFGEGSSLNQPMRGDLQPAIRRGRITRSGLLAKETPPRQAIAIAVPVERGDSGGPVLDAEGRMRGIVSRRTLQGGIAERATDVRQLLEREGVVSGPSPSADLFRAAMAAFWDLDFATAQAGFGRTLQVFPRHTLAGVERARAAALAAGDYRLSGRRRPGLLLAIANLALAAALGCAIGLVRPHLAGGRDDSVGR